MSKTLGGEGGGADDDEGEEPEEDAEDSRPLWGGEVGSLCKASLQSGHCSFLEFEEITMKLTKTYNSWTRILLTIAHCCHLGWDQHQ